MERAPGPGHIQGAREEQGKSPRASGSDTLTFDMFIEILLRRLQEVTIFVGGNIRASKPCCIAISLVRSAVAQYPSKAGYLSLVHYVRLSRLYLLPVAVAGVFVFCQQDWVVL